MILDGARNLNRGPKNMDGSDFNGYNPDAISCEVLEESVDVSWLSYVIIGQGWRFSNLILVSS